MLPRVPQTYTFGPFSIDMAEPALRRDGVSVPLAPKVFEVLLALVECRGRVVRKEELLQRVWAGAFVEESNLTQSVYLLRRALGGGANGDQYIVTVPRRGYKFTATTEGISEAAAPLSAPAPRPETAKWKPGSSAATGRSVFTYHPPVRSLAVLPLVNETSDPVAEYLSDGIPEAIINNLARLPQLRVVNRNTAFRYKGVDTDPRSVGGALGVDAVMMGRVLRFGNKIVIRTELVDVGGGWQLWGAQYDGPTADVLGLQEEVAAKVMEALSSEFAGWGKGPSAGSQSAGIDAHRLYLRGRHHWGKYTRAGIGAAIECFDLAVKAEPNFAPAYIGLADSYSRLSSTFLAPREVMPKARLAALRALEIDDRLVEAHASLGLIKTNYEWDWSGADDEFRRAIDRNPDYASTHHWYASHLMMSGRLDEAITEIESAQELDPLSSQFGVNLGMIYFHMGRYEQAAKHFRKVLAVNPEHFPALIGLGLVYERQREFGQAVAAFRSAYSAEASNTTASFLAYTHAVAGDADEARRLLGRLLGRSRLGYVSGFGVAIVYAALGETDRAFRWLEKAYVDRDDWLISIKIGPWLNRLRGDCRFADLLRRVHP